MSYKNISQLIQEYSTCKDCNLHLARDKNEDAIFIGQGSTTAELLVVVPRPIFIEPNGPIAFEITSEEFQMYKKITDKLQFDRQKIYITTTVACQPKDGHSISMSNVDACRSRINKLVEIINPKAVMLLGPESLYSWTGENISKSKMGIVPLDKERVCYWSHDFSRYIKTKSSDRLKSETMAKEIFSHWKELKELINNV